MVSEQTASTCAYKCNPYSLPLIPDTDDLLARRLPVCNVRHICPAHLWPVSQKPLSTAANLQHDATACTSTAGVGARNAELAHLPARAAHLCFLHGQYTTELRAEGMFRSPRSVHPTRRPGSTRATRYSSDSAPAAMPNQLNNKLFCSSFVANRCRSI